MQAFKNIDRIVDGKEFQSWLESAAPERNVPTLWESEKTLTPIGQSMYQVLSIQAFRPDRLSAAISVFVNNVSVIMV